MPFIWTDIDSGQASNPDTDINPLGQVVQAHDALLTVETPVVPTLLASWVNRGAGFPVISYRKLSMLNCVHIGGQAQSGTLNAVFMVLNVGYRPLNQWIGANSTGVIIIDTNGNVSGSGMGSAFLQFSIIFPLDW